MTPQPKRAGKARAANLWAVIDSKGRFVTDDKAARHLGHVLIFRSRATARAIVWMPGEKLVRVRIIPVPPKSKERRRRK